MAQRDLTLNIGAKTIELNTALGKMRKDVRRSTGEVSAAFKQTGMQMTAALTAPLALFGRSAIKNFASFEQSMAKVKAVSGATASEFQALTKNAEDLGASTRFTSQEVAGLQLEYSKLGFSSDEILKVTKATLALAQATDSDLSQASAVAGSTLRAFGLDASETGRIVDVMAASFSSTALDINGFQDSMKYVAPVAKAAGISVEQTTAMLGALSNAGIKGSAAGTALRRIFAEMADSGLPAADALRKLSEEGIELADAKDEVGRNAMSALLVLTKMQPEIDALTESLLNSKGAAQEMAGIMDDTLEGSFAKLNSATDALTRSFGDTMSPVVRGLADTLTILTSAFTAMPAPIRAVLVALGTLVAAGGPLLLLSPQLLAARANWIVFKAAIMETRAAALLFTPHGALMAAAIGLTIASISLFKYAADEHKRKLKDIEDAADRAAKAHKGLMKSMTEEGEKLTDEQLSARIQELQAAQTELTDPGMEAIGEILALQQRMGTAFTMQAPAQETIGQGADGQLTGGIREASKETKELFNIQNELTILQAELTKRTTAKAAADAAAAKEARALADAEREKAEALAQSKREKAALETERAGKALGLAPEDLNVGGVLSALSKDIPDPSPFQAAFMLTDEQIQQADAQVQEQVDKAKQRMDAFKQNVQGFGMSIAGTLQGIFTSLVDGSKSFGQILGDIIKQLLIKVAALLAAFAALSVLFPSAAPKSLGKFLKGGLGIPEFADGGIVSGPQLLLAGEYPGASTNPEVIAPLSKLQNMIGGAGGNLSARISGRDILLSSSRDKNNARRQFTSTLI